MDIYDKIKNKLIDEEIYTKVKDYSKERHRVETYYEIGRLLSEAGNRYGDNVIGEYSKRLMIDIGKKYTRSVLFRMKQFYNICSDTKVAPVVRQLTWSNILLLLPIKDINKLNYYIEKVVTRNLSKRELASIIKNNEYERLPEDTKNKLITNNNDLGLIDLVKDPIVVNNYDNYEVITEKVLKQIILNDIPGFLNELGNGFAFLGSEFKIKVGNNYNYIDILLFNTIYNCYVVVELKVTKLKKEHIGQIEVYMNYIDKNIKSINHDKTIGLIVCRENDRYIIEYSTDKRIIAREYIVV